MQAVYPSSATFILGLKPILNFQNIDFELGISFLFTKLITSGYQL